MRMSDWSSDVCSSDLDGAAALVLCDVESALGLNKSVVFRAAQQVNDFLPMSKRDITLFEGCEQAWNQALESAGATLDDRSEEHTSELQSLMRISYAVFCLKKQTKSRTLT